MSPASTLRAARHSLRALEHAVREARENPERILAIELQECLPTGAPGANTEAFFHRRNLDVVLARHPWSGRSP
ncbi:hypothetical protein LXT21_43140 [Myxococcus sp. K38C18041901]|uniref:hypothetical protein n=1 Tax=Myxococcus guangdongensis TaxID=2906760 RepID=UPI0020A79012|nr:hypothetical protein [Myxococcus guangdongensis]MCP3065583.1 hypothetical protein [Myxococcus guangdongensis]